MKYAGEFLMLGVLGSLILFFFSFFIFPHTYHTRYTFIGLPEEYASIHQRPSPRSQVLGKVGNGEIGKILGNNGEWSLIETEKGLIGYVLKDYLDPIQLKNSTLILYKTE